MVTANTAERLAQHYVDNYRRLPWRSAPGGPPPEPYRVWLSEVMLQQTTVASVQPRFERFIERWPTVEDLAAARDEDVLGEWAGLGYYARARNLLACAREVVRRGGFPGTAAELRSLPGIGGYTSAAIAAIAFGERAAPVDTNIRRVIARLQALEQPSQREVEQGFLTMLPNARAGDLAQALMDLGAALCRPRNPRCSECPLRPDCAAYALGTPELFPRPRSRAIRPHRHGTAFWIERGGAVWLVRRPAQGVLGGMAALPGEDWTDAPGDSGPAIGVVRHVFTHFSLDLAVVRRAEPQGAGWWQPTERLAQAGLPTLYRRAAALALAAREAA